MLSMGRKRSFGKRKRYIIVRKWSCKESSKYILSSDLTLEVSSEVVEKLYIVSNNTKIEDCGVFTGSLTRTGSHRINRMSPSCLLADSKSRYACVRNVDIANDFIKNDFLNSNSTRVYFGEWHTHPEEIPYPSSTDISSIVDIYHTSDHPLDIIFFAIVGYKDIYWGYYDGRNIFKLKNVTII